MKSFKQTTRFTELQYNKLIIEAAEYGVTVSELIRHKVDNEYHNNSVIIDAVKKLKGQIGWSGNNLNQIAKAINILNKDGKFNSLKLDMSLARLTAIEEINRQVYDLLRKVLDAYTD